MCRLLCQCLVQMEERLRLRAREIREPGVYIGFLEWLVWGELHGFAVQLLFGRDCVNLREQFALELVPDYLRPNVKTAVAAAVGIDGLSGRWITSDHHGRRASHFVIARPLAAGAEPWAKCEELSVGAGRLCAQGSFAGRICLAANGVSRRLWP